MQELHTNYCRRWQEELKDELEQNKRQTKSLKRSLVRVLHNVIDLQKSTQKNSQLPFAYIPLTSDSGQFEKGPGYDRQANEGQFRVSAIQKVKNR